MNVLICQFLTLLLDFGPLGEEFKTSGFKILSREDSTVVLFTGQSATNCLSAVRGLKLHGSTKSATQVHSSR